MAERFNNKTNGVTPRRLLAFANPRLRELITETIGDGWLVDLESCAAWSRYAEDPRSGTQWRAVKHANKTALPIYVSRQTRRRRSIPTALFDIQVKRIHEYKRQL